MCNAAPLSFFRKPRHIGHLVSSVESFVQGPDDAASRIAILPDIYGCSTFYEGLSAHFAELGARVFLVNPFAGLGDLREPTREAAFERRHKVADKAFLDNFEAFARDQQITGVVGFCLGGLYVFELARRGLESCLIGMYGFPQGLPNRDPLPIPFDYLESIRKSYTMFIGRNDRSVGPDNVLRLERQAKSNPALNLVVFDDVGHDFLTALDEPSGAARRAALEALKFCERELLR